MPFVLYPFATAVTVTAVAVKMIKKTKSRGQVIDWFSLRDIPSDLIFRYRKNKVILTINAKEREENQQKM